MSSARSSRGCLLDNVVRPQLPGRGGRREPPADARGERGGAASSENGAFVYAQTTLHVVETTVRWWSFRLSAPGEIEAANGPYRGKKGTVLVGLGGYQMFDSLAIDRDGALQLTGELLTLRSEQRAAPYGAAPRPETSAQTAPEPGCRSPSAVRCSARRAAARPGRVPGRAVAGR